jgi:MipA family protein
MKASLNFGSLILRGAFGLALAMALAPAHSQEIYDAVRLNAAPLGKHGGMYGGFVRTGKAFMGSEENKVTILPVIDYQWGNGWFAGVSNGIGYNFSSDPSFQYGTRITFNMGRKVDDDKVALRGFKDIDPAAEFGLFANYSITPEVKLTSSFRTGSGVDNKGNIIDLGVAYSTKVAPDWRLNLGAYTSIVNKDYAQDFFGVTPAEATTTGYKAYAPGSGVRDTRAKVGVVYTYSPSTYISAGLEVGALAGDFKDSPLTKKDNFASASFALTFTF